MKAELEIDMYIDIGSKGVNYGLYFGDACMPAYESEQSWEEIVDRTVGYHVVPLSETIGTRDLKELEKLADRLDDIAILIRKKIEKYR